MKNVLVKIVFGIFALCLLAAAVAFNLEMMKLALIMFGVTMISAGVLILLNQIGDAAKEEK